MLWGELSVLLVIGFIGSTGSINCFYCFFLVEPGDDVMGRVIVGFLLKAFLPRRQGLNKRPRQHWKRKRLRH